MNKIDIEELYWSDLEELESDKESLEKVLDYIKDYDARDIEELSQIIRLYSNPSGALTLEFAELIANFYIKDRIRFFKALNLSKDEIGHLVYVFRNLKVFEDEDEEEKEVLESQEFSIEELEAASDFFKMYKKICSS